MDASEEGQLLKQNQLTLAWRMRYFALYGTELVMFDKKDGKEKGRISLKQGTCALTCVSHHLPCHVRCRLPELVGRLCEVVH
jgi:hypothetical protein